MAGLDGLGVFRQIASILLFICAVSIVFNVIMNMSLGPTAFISVYPAIEREMST